jgi:hypothetical protein
LLEREEVCGQNHPENHFFVLYHVLTYNRQRFHNEISVM